MEQIYKSKLDLIETEQAIKVVKDTFERKLASALSLQRVSAPRFLEAGNGLQDDLAGTQIPVSFSVKHSSRPIEIVHSLAKWKREALQRYNISENEGLYTDMDAIRKDEDVSDIHSVYVDQWDWEKRITPEQRTLAFLKETVTDIYKALLETEQILSDDFPVLRPRLPKKISFIHSQALEDQYPELTPKERELKAAQEYGAYFLIGIGAPLASGRPHDLRAADYDDWITINEEGSQGLNGDIIVLEQEQGRAIELSSMGVRVSRESLETQLDLMLQTDKKELSFQKAILEERLPQAIGGGLGQSRICMVLLQKLHIGEVQVSVWPKQMIADYAKQGAVFL